MENYEEPVVNIHYYKRTDVLTASDENVAESNTNDTDITWGETWK